MQITIDTRLDTADSVAPILAFLIEHFGMTDEHPKQATAPDEHPKQTTAPGTLESAVFAPATIATSSETDVHGIPWDERIHASTKTTNADGSWRTRRGVDPTTIATVSAELRHGAPLAPAAALAPPPPPPPAAELDAPPPPPPPAAELDAPPPPPPPPPPPAANEISEGFKRIMRKVHEGTKADLITQAEVTNIVTQIGLDSLARLAGNASKQIEFEAIFDAMVL